MYLCHQPLDPKTRRIRAAGFACFFIYVALTGVGESFGHRYQALYNGLGVLFASCALVLFCFVRRRCCARVPRS